MEGLKNFFVGLCLGLLILIIGLAVGNELAKEFFIQLRDTFGAVNWGMRGTAQGLAEFNVNLSLFFTQLIAVAIKLVFFVFIFVVIGRATRWLFEKKES